MLTWAVCWFMVRSGLHNGFWVLFSLGCDVGIFYYISEAVKALACVH